MMRKLAKLFIVHALFLAFTQCEGFNSAPDPPPPLEAEIMRIDVEPNPVQKGDTVVFTCIVKDSLAENLEFTWNIPNRVESIPTTKNTFSFEVNLEPGEYGASVSVNDTLKSDISTYKSFYFNVIQQQ
ncbi:PKD domain-containing protein [Gracilimonas mengyeensis]|uniref:Ig-like domain-containing protein n=1 Tax=Gracilimonas mengyeensis TaxID=1302730 RepID=A0A521EA17_9BACT|nr:hypothetical protein [Gracilimonas mengyeensis]SMO80777.1 hypothetical protein SAMN06265219_11161 [Gracilimonas mengyeensis]